MSEPPIIEVLPSPPAPDPLPPQPRKRWWQRRWVTISEFVGVAALAIAVLGYLDSHKERSDARAEKAQETQAASQAAAARASLTLTGEPSSDGARLTLKPMREGQAVQSQRYIFPKAVLNHVMEVSAAQPQIDRGWVADGLVKAAREAGGAQAGEGQLPVGVETTYIEDGETRTDRSVYGLGYRVIRGGLFSGSRVTLQGLELDRRGVPGDLQAAVESRWKTQASRGLQGGA